MAIRRLNGTNIVFLAVVVLIIGLLIFGDMLRPEPAPTKTVEQTAQAETVAATTEESGVPKPDVPVSLAERYKAITKAIDMDRVKATVYELGSVESRMVGYPGEAKAAKYVEEELRAAGLEDVKVEEFDVTVPVDKGSKIVVGDQEIELYALWPNLVRTSHIPPEGMDVHVIDAKSGRLPDFDGKEVKGSAALIDFNSGTEWLNAPRLGAKAVIFVEPDETMRGEGEAKFSAIPVSMPRFWISKENAAKLRELIAQGEAEEAKVYCNMPWEKIKAKNIVGVIPGSDPKLQNEWIVLHSHYDGTSVVPALAPSAEGACGIAGLIEMVRLFKQPEFAPKRSVMVVATSAHYQGLGGMRSYLESHIDEYRQISGMDKFHRYLNTNWPAGVVNWKTPIVPILAAAVLLLVVWWIWGKMRNIQRKHAWLVAVPVVLSVLVVLFSYNLYTVFAKGFDYEIPNPPKFYLWAGLDLSSQSEGVGVFYKGYFYDFREDIQGKFSDVASRSRENAERVAYTLGFFDRKDARFADGVNPISGKNWRNFIPGKFALDSEVVTLAGGKGISFATIDDGRQVVDTPFDTVERINFTNLEKQLQLIACLTDHWFHDTNTTLDEESVPAKIIDRNTIAAVDPLIVGYIQGVYTNPYGKGKNYYKPSSDKEILKNADGRIKLTSALPEDAEKVYIYQKPLSRLGVAKDDPCKFTRMGLQGGLARLSGTVVQYDPRKSFVPNLLIGDCLAVVRSPHKSFMGVRANIVDKSSSVVKVGKDKFEGGEFVIPGVAPLTAYGGAKMTSIGAYKLDPVNGDIICAPDQGNYGEFYPKEFPITTGFKDMPVIVFNCKATSVYDLIDPQSLTALSGLNIYEGETHATPRQYGYAVAVPEPQNPHVEDMAVIFTEDTAKSGALAAGQDDKQKRVRIQLVMSAGPAANRLLLLGNSEKVLGEKIEGGVPAEGLGYDFTEGGTLQETAYKVAWDMWTLDEYRLSSLAEKGVINDSLNELHATAKKYLDLADQAKDSKNYSVFDSYCRAAWGFEARAYPDVTSTSQDVVNGVIFYLFLMLPFAYFCERLFFAFPDLKWQLLAFFLIFISIFMIFKFVHPAFQIAGNALIILIAFVMLALSGLTIFIISNKFEEQLKQFNQSVSGVHKADIKRMSVAAAAFSLGISNMRRRKARTVLTCITLVLLTFTVLSFTSIVSELKFNKVPAKKDDDTHVYNGIMFRTAMWEPMQEISYRLLKDEFGNEGKSDKVYPVAPRAWFYGTVMGEQSFLTLKRGNKSYDARAAAGMVPDEAEIMELNTTNRKIFVAGDWFGYKNGKKVSEEVDPYSIIIPDAIAEKLDIKPSDVGKAQVEFAGAKYTVVAILDSAKFKKLKDLDNEPLTPVDFILMSKQGQQQQQGGAEAGFREYTHLEPDSVFIVPYDTVMNMGGSVRSIAVKYGTFKEVQDQLSGLMKRLGLNLYAGMDGAIYRYSSIAGSSSKGFSNVFIPILIASLIVLNTMLGSVFERVKEIGIFSSIGLAPNHIAILFIAESMVYANLGAVAGYVVGQTASKLLAVTNAMPGLYLNFSSSSAVVSSIIVVFVVLASTLYPARKASEVATPAVDRAWKVPEPVGDEWNIVLPFAVTGEQARGVNGFLQEWFQAYEEYSIGDFVTQDVKTGEIDTDEGKAFTVSCKTWLAPFDLGVSQYVMLTTEPTTMEDVYEVRVTITRESGDVSNWKRVNRRFLNTLRKQFLIWRTMGHEEREKYLQVEPADEKSEGQEVART